MITHGTKIGPHVLSGGQGIEWVRQLIQRGVTPPIFKSVDNNGILLEIKAISPATKRVARFVTPGWDSAEGILGWSELQKMEIASAVVDYCFQRTNAEERAAIDYFEVLNEADPPGVDGWRAFGSYLRYVALEATRRGIRIITPATNYGTPEWDEMVALVGTGVFRALKDGGHAWSVHEGVNPFSNDPLTYGPIPGAPYIPKAGPTAFRYRYLNHLLQQRGEQVPILVSEFYAGGGYHIENFIDVMNRFMHYDLETRQDWYVIGVLGFTMDPIAGWWEQNYNPFYMHPSFIDYIVREAMVPNATQSVTNNTHFVTASLLNVRLFPWAGNVTPPIVRRLVMGTQVRSYGFYKDNDMAHGWHCISPNGNEWVSGFYLASL